MASILLSLGIGAASGGWRSLSRVSYRGLFPSPPLFDRMPTYRTQGKRSLNFLSAAVSGKVSWSLLIQKNLGKPTRKMLGKFANYSPS